jgi:hypothetical protein
VLCPPLEGTVDSCLLERKYSIQEPLKYCTCKKQEQEWNLNNIPEWIE